VEDVERTPRSTEPRKGDATEKRIAMHDDARDARYMKGKLFETMSAAG